MKKREKERREERVRAGTTENVKHIHTPLEKGKKNGAITREETTRNVSFSQGDKPEEVMSKKGKNKQKRRKRKKRRQG